MVGIFGIGIASSEHDECGTKVAHEAYQIEPTSCSQDHAPPPQSARLVVLRQSKTIIAHRLRNQDDKPSACYRPSCIYPWIPVCLVVITNAGHARFVADGLWLLRTCKCEKSLYIEHFFRHVDRS